MIVHVVIISDINNEYFKIHSVYTNEDDARVQVAELESSLDEDMVVTYESHEVTE